jgi:hypothetical protein
MNLESMRGPVVDKRDGDNGPRRFVRSWLSFDETRPARARKMWMLAATVAMLLAASALLAWFGNHSN